MKRLISFLLPLLLLGAAQAQQVVKPFNGGTGVSQANTKTITLSGPFTTSGSNSLTFITTGTTNATVPPGSVVLMARDTVDTVTNKSIDAGQLTGTISCVRVPAFTGDVTSSSGSCATTLGNIPTATPMAGSLLGTNIAAPSTPASGKTSVYVDSSSKNFAAKNDAGTVNHGIQTRTATASNWIRAVDDDGSTSISQPAFSDISGTVAASQVTTPKAFQIRLSLSSTDPVPQADQTAKTSINVLPYKGGDISLYDGSSTWNLRNVGAGINCALGTLANATIYDIFLYDNSGTAACDTFVAWRNSGQAITGATNATPVVITANSHGLSNGDEVYITGLLITDNLQGLANGTWIVANKTTNTFELTGSAGLGGTYVASTGQLSARATLHALQNGALVKAGATTRLYVGSFLTTATTTTEDSDANRFLWNYYNQVTRRARKIESTAGHTYTTATWRPWNNSVTTRASFIIGVGVAYTPITLVGTTLTATGANAILGVSLNNIVTPDIDNRSEVSGVTASERVSVVTNTSPIAPGLSYLQAMELSTATGTFYNYAVTATLQN